MRFLIFLIFNIFIFSYCSFSPRDFFIDFLKTVNNNKTNIELPSLCFGYLFNIYYNNLKKYYKENNFHMVLKNVENIFLDVYLSCPNEEIIGLFKAINNTLFSDTDNDPQYQNKIYKAFTLVYNEYFFKINSDEDEVNDDLYKKIPVTLGEIVNIFTNTSKEISNKETNNSLFSFINDPTTNEISANFTLGILDGLLKNGKKGECLKTIMNNKDKIKKIIVKNYNKFNEGEKIGKILSSFVFDLLGVSGVMLNCNMLQLGTIIGKISYVESSKDVIIYAIKNYEKIKDLWEMMLQYFEFKMYRKSGSYIGKIITQVLNYTIN